MYEGGAEGGFGVSFARISVCKGFDKVFSDLESVKLIISNDLSMSFSIAFNFLVTFFESPDVCAKFCFKVGTTCVLIARASAATSFNCFNSCS